MPEHDGHDEHAGPLVDEREGFRVIACEACGFRHVLPLPRPEELARLYDEDYYEREKPLYLQQTLEDLDWWKLVYRERYETLEEHLGAAGRRRLLDVGSGPGFFLAEGNARGWETLGIEPSRQAAEHARSLGVEVVEEFLDAESAERLGSFGAAHLCNVLEHVPDPAHLLELAHGLLDPGGLLMVVVPNDYNPLQRALREERGFAPWWVAPPHHLNYFDPPALTSLVERTGFAVLETEGTFPMELFLLMGDDYVGKVDVGRACHAKRKRLEQTLDAAGLGAEKRRLYRALAAAGMGREVQLVARRAS
jgi:SAM-dependent methyltransferase